MTTGNGANGPFISQDQWMGLVRQVLPFLAGVAVAKGWLTADQSVNLVSVILQVAGPFGLVVGGIMSYFANSRHSILTSAAQIPEVKKVVVDDQSLTESVSSPKVDTH